MCKNCDLLAKDHWMNQNMLPIWVDGWNKIQYKFPKELRDLSDAEKMLIQRASPFIPLHHIKDGKFGIKGHVCMSP